jgi:threonine dehydrogenase-like Zn-dependent dehydrogenase
MTDYNLPPKMRALTLSGTGIEHLKIERVPTPQAGPNQLLARVDAAGICTSLIKLIDQGPAHSYVYGRDIARYPLILGDEGAVTLVEVGEAQRNRYRPGERYVIQPAVDHPPINFCERYRDNARGVQKLGVGYSLPGHLAEYILIQEEILAAGCLLPLPAPDMAAAHVAMSEPLSCVVSAQDHHMHLVQKAPLAPREVVKGLRSGGVTVIMGAGAMGRMHVELALSYRPRVVICSDFIQERLDIVARLFGPRAAQLGVDLRAVNSAATDLKALVDQMTDYRGADDVIVAVGSGKAIETAQTYVGRGAVLNLFGGLKRGQDVIGFDTTTIHYKEINVTGSSGGSPWDVARTLELMLAGEMNAGNHITRIGDLEHAPAFLEMIKAQTLDGKAVVYPHRRTAEILTVPRWTAEDEARYLGAA